MRRILVAAVLVPVLAVGPALGGAAGPALSGAAAGPAPSGAGSRVGVVDNLGNTVFFDSAPERVVSLSPGATEILFALGAGDKLRAVSKYCDYPSAARKLPKVGDFMNPSLEAIIAQKPDLVVATGGVQKEIVLNLKRMSVPLLMLYPHSVEEVFGNITALGRVLRRDAAAGALVSGIRDRVKRLTASVASTPERDRPRVYLEMWGDPLMAIGDLGYVGDLIRLAGGVNVARGLAEEYPRISPEFLVKADPDVIILSHCDDPGGAVDFVRKRPGWEQVRAVRTKRVYGDLNMDLLLRPGPRLADGLEQLVRRFRGKR